MTSETVGELIGFLIAMAIMVFLGVPAFAYAWNWWFS